MRTPETDVSVQIVTRDTEALWVEVRGEADLATHDQLQDALEQIALDGSRSVHLNLADLTFCDVLGFRHLLAFAVRVHRQGRRITTHGAGRPVRMMSTAFGMDSRLNLV